MAFLGLDLGSTYTKIFYLQGGRATSAHEAAAPTRLRHGALRFEVDATLYYEQVLALLEKWMTADVQGVLISTQMHGYVLTDEAFLPVSPYVSWQDKLGARELPEIIKLLGNDAATPSGVPMKGNLALCALMARAAEGEKIKAGTRLCTLGGYIIGRLTGEFVCHMTNAAPTGLADVRRGIWNEALLARAGLNHLGLPRIHTGLGWVGRWRGVNVSSDMGDQQMCALGAALLPEKTLHVSVGTAGLIGCLTAQWGEGAYENRPWVTPRQYLRTVSALPGGRDVSAFNTFIRAQIEELSGAPVSEEKVWQFMTRGDAYDENWKMPQLPPQNAVSAFYADMAQAYLAAARKLALPIERVCYSGGCVAKNPPLQEAIQRALGVPAGAFDNHVAKGMAAWINMLKGVTV